MQLPRLEQRRVQLKLFLLYQLVHNLAFYPQAPPTSRNISVNVGNNNPLFLLSRPICYIIALWNNLVLLLVHHLCTLAVIYINV